jgi:glycosyltransferase involved in cell wall biosynthesis
LGREPAYVLITAAHNEQATISRTIESVRNQSVLPRRWVIVSDGSTDQTTEIVRRFAQESEYVRAVTITRQGGRSFRNKVEAIRAGEAELGDCAYEYFGILDADVEVESNYFESMAREFERDSNLGIAGGEVIQYVDSRWRPRIKSKRSVAGAVQLFRAACYRSCGGLVALRYGGEDAAAEIIARMKGWSVRTFPAHRVIHYGYVGAKDGGRLRARFRRGQMNFQLGYATSYQLSGSVFRTIESPYVIGSVLEVLGFLISWIRHRRPSLAPSLVRFLRQEQRSELRALFRRRAEL